jgi:hypothetical protein
MAKECDFLHKKSREIKEILGISAERSFSLFIVNQHKPFKMLRN